MRFTLRDLIWLSIVLFMGCGWFYSATSLSIAHAECEQELRLCNQELALLRSLPN
jgi:hypothetical protein